MSRLPSNYKMKVVTSPDLLFDGLFKYKCSRRALHPGQGWENQREGTCPVNLSFITQT